LPEVNTEHAPSELSDHDQMLLLLLRACNRAAQQIFNHVQGRMTRTMLSRVHTVSGAARLYVRASFYRNVPQDAATRIRHARFRSQIIVPLAAFSLVSLGPRGSWNFLDDSSMFDHDSTLL